MRCHCMCVVRDHEPELLKRLLRQKLVEQRTEFCFRVTPWASAAERSRPVAMPGQSANVRRVGGEEKVRGLGANGIYTSTRDVHDVKHLREQPCLHALG